MSDDAAYEREQAIDYAKQLVAYLRDLAAVYQTGFLYGSGGRASSDGLKHAARIIEDGSWRDGLNASEQKALEDKARYELAERKRRERDEKIRAYRLRLEQEDM